MNKRGFTLIEIMISMAILGAIMAALYSSWYAIMRGTKSGLEAAAEVQRSRIAMRSVQDALLSLQFFTQNSSHYAFWADSSSDFAELSLVAKLPKSYPRSGRFGDLSVRRVTFDVEKGPTGLNQLVMRQQPYLMETNVDEEQFPVVLAKDIRVFTLDFWDPGKGEWIEGSLFTNQLPKMIKITMGFGNGKVGAKRPEDFVVRVVGLSSVIVPRDYQMPILPPTGQPTRGPGGPRGGPPPGQQPPPRPAK